MLKKYLSWFDSIVEQKNICSAGIHAMQKHTHYDATSNSGEHALHESLIFTLQKLPESLIADIVSEWFADFLSQMLVHQNKNKMKNTTKQYVSRWEHIDIRRSVHDPSYCEDLFLFYAHKSLEKAIWWWEIRIDIDLGWKAMLNWMSDW